MNGRVPYAEVVARLRIAVAAALPETATVAVVTRGDDALLELDGRRALHFPAAESGAYAGHHPADGAAAVALLEDARRRGAEYLVFPATAFWWLEHYGELRAHLDRHYRVTLDDPEAFVVFDLSGERGSAAAARGAWERRNGRRERRSLRQRVGGGLRRRPGRAPMPAADGRGAAVTHDESPDAVLAAIERSGLLDERFYLETYPDAPASGLSAAEHFCAVGWARGAHPNVYFDTEWYLRTNADVRAANVNPLWHYIAVGEDEGRRPSPFFDPHFYRRTRTALGGLHLADFLTHVAEGRWRSPTDLFDVEYYLGRYPDVAEAGVDPVQHYATTGHAEGRDPSPHFHTSYYRAKYLEGRHDANPLAHYVEIGRALGHYTKPGDHDLLGDVTAQIRHSTSPGGGFEELDATIAASSPARAKLIAFYLPQFHAIPENDRWWGAGFTEWRNVMRGAPRFVGHYQPRVPRDLGFYDLTSPGVLAQQIELARQAAIHGFAFYYYSFNGRRLLERPVETFLAERSLDFPFCLVWANENWTRRWDGDEAEVLVSQEYDPERDAELVDDFQRHFADPRYIRIDGRPLLVIYRVDVIPDARRAIARWRKLWSERHGERPLVFLAQTFGARDPRDHGLDGAVEFPPHKLAQGRRLLNSEVKLLDPSFSGQVYDYADIAAASLAEPAPDYPLAKTIVPSWDNDARRQGTGLVLHGSSPGRYEAWLRALVHGAEQRPVHGEPLVFVNAWNEWAEGAYLEPDVHYGSAYLNATARAVSGARTDGRRKVLLVGHDAHPFGAQINLWHFGNVLRHQFGCEVAFLLLGGGDLVERYEELGPVAVAEGHEAVAAHVGRLRVRGFGAAVTNTAATGWVVPHLKRAAFRTASLVHELPTLVEEYGLTGALDDIVRDSDRIVVAADAVGRALFGRSRRAREKLVIRPQGLYLDGEPPVHEASAVRRELAIPDGGRVVLGAGSGDLRKGIDIFLTAAKLAVRTDPDLDFVWVGKLTDDAARWLSSDIRGELAGRIHLVPHTDEVGRYFAAASAFFLSSREDPYPSVVLEALHAGLPVVALRGSGGIDELVSRHGVLVDRNDLSAIVDALVSAAHEDDPGARSARRRTIAADYRYDEYAFDVLRLLDESLPKVSVVVPNYNYAPYLAARVRSVLAQTHPIFELIVLDDCSTDDSLAELQRLAAETGGRMRVVPNEHNSGSPFRQWQKACELARGDYLWIAEADDLSRPDFLERVLRRIGTADVAFAFTDSAQIDEDGRPLGASYKPYCRAPAGGALEEDFVVDGPSFVRECLVERNVVLNVSSVVWNRRCLAEVLRRHAREVTGYRLAGDWFLYAAAALTRRQVAYVAEPLNVHRRHGGGVTSSLDAQRHVDEVERVHRAVAAWVDADDVVRERMVRYRAELVEQFGLEPRSNGARRDGRRRPRRAVTPGHERT